MVKGYPPPGQTNNIMTRHMIKTRRHKLYEYDDDLSLEDGVEHIWFSRIKHSNAVQAGIMIPTSPKDASKGEC